MNLLEELVSLPLLIDIVLVVTVVEAVALLAYHRVTGKGVALRDVGINLLSGLCLMLALRSGLRDSSGAWVVLFLLAAGLAHAADIVIRWRHRSASAGKTHSAQPYLAGDGHIASGAGVSR